MRLLLDECRFHSNPKETSVRGVLILTQLAQVHDYLAEGLAQVEP